MNSPAARLGVFGAGLVAIFLAAAALGTAVGPIDVGDSPADHDAEHPAQHSDHPQR